jgi:hypothetical protein
VLDLFQAPFYHLTLVSDPDHILDDEVIVSKLKERGLEIVTYQDSASFRYIYEVQYRQALDQVHLLVVSEEEALENMPYDLWEKGNKVYLKKSNLYPELSPAIVRQLDFRTLDLLAAGSLSGNLSSERATIDYILKRIYKIAYDAVDTLAESIALVIRWHQLQHEVPDVVRQYFIDSLQSKCPEVPIGTFVSSYHSFIRYLQQEWNFFVHNRFPNDHFFWDSNVRSAVGTLFLEEKLSPVYIGDRPVPHAFSFGIQRDSTQHKTELYERLIHQIETLLSLPTDRRAWIQIAQLYGKAKHLSFELELKEQEKQQLMERTIEERFEEWITSHYGALATLSDRHTPVMLHKVVEFMHMDGKDKKALLVLDGMSFVQWAQIDQALTKDFQSEANGTFAWIPTLTPVSRQAIFSGEIPRYFYDSIHTTAKEEKAWKLAWERNGIPSSYVTYERGLGQGQYDRDKIKALSGAKVKIAGLIIDTIDQFSHNTIQGQLGMHAEISVWLKQGYLQSLLTDLLDAGFAVYVTSDHGNKESKGIGPTRDGTLPETRGERVRIYRDVVLRDQAAVQYSSKQWHGAGLPDDYHVLLAKPGEAFVREGDIVVSHGGASMEEVIVPFVRIYKK